MTERELQRGGRQWNAVGSAHCRGALRPRQQRRDRQDPEAGEALL